jgi:serine/threonine protein kinase
MGSKNKLREGARFERWTLKELIGEGGNGVVWKAENSERRIVAIKFLKSYLFGRQDDKRFRHEIEFLRNENQRDGILPLIDSYLPAVFTENDRPWHVTPLCENFAKLELSGPAKLPDLVAKIEEVARTLAIFHK